MFLHWQLSTPLSAVHASVKGLPNATGSEVMVKRSDTGTLLVTLSIEARKGVSEVAEETGMSRRAGRAHIVEIARPDCLISSIQVRRGTVD